MQSVVMQSVMNQCRIGHLLRAHSQPPLVSRQVDSAFPLQRFGSAPGLTSPLGGMR